MSSFAQPYVDKASALWSQLLAQFFKLSKREQLLIGGTLIVGFFVLVYMVYQPIQDAFDRQSLALVEAQNRSRSVPGILERYLKLKARRDVIESRYREVEFKEGALSHLENLIRTKAMVNSGFTIKDSPPRPFGGNYEQVPFSIRFSTSNLETLVDFLKELVHGPRPLILGRVDLAKSRLGDRIEVDLDVSSLRKTSK